MTKLNPETRGWGRVRGASEVFRLLRVNGETYGLRVYTAGPPYRWEAYTYKGGYQVLFACGVDTKLRRAKLFCYRSLPWSAGAAGASS